MSNTASTLPEDAPIDEPAVPSVEDQAPGEGDEVAEESVGRDEDGKVVPAHRFNGLMGRFNRTQSELEAERSRVAELEARLAEKQQTQEESSDVADTSHIESEVSELKQMLVAERLDNARKDALVDYPEAAPFGDLIVADTPEDIREMTRLVAERAKANQPEPTGGESAEGGEEQGQTGEVEQEGSTQEQSGETGAAGDEGGSTEPPVAGGGAAFDGVATADERVNEAIEQKDFAAFLNAASERRAMEDTTNVG